MLTLKTQKVRKSIKSVQISSIHRFPASDPTDEQLEDDDFKQTSPSVVLSLQDFDADGNIIGGPRNIDLMADHPGTAALDAALDEIETTIAKEVGA